MRSRPPPTLPMALSAGRRLIDCPRSRDATRYASWRRLREELEGQARSDNTHAAKRCDLDVLVPSGDVLLRRIGCPVIRRECLSIGYAGFSVHKGCLSALWLYTTDRSAWVVIHVVIHVVKRHGGRVENVVILEFDVPRSWLRRCRKASGTPAATYCSGACAA